MVARRIVQSARDTSTTELPATSVSAGITVIDGRLAAAEVMRLADGALYDAKRAGGDRQAMSEQPSLTQSL